MNDFPQYEQPPSPLSPFVQQLRPSRPLWLVPALLLATAAFTTTIAGATIWRTGDLSLGGAMRAAVTPSTLATGLPFSITILAILLAHEMGHYLTCRYYHISATLPYVIPFPPPVGFFGTFGAVIKIKSLFGNARELFDVGVAGPLSGFLLIVPALAFGLANSTTFAPSGNGGASFSFGEPLLYKLGTIFFFSGDPANIDLHPIGWAAWFGMLATSLNLLPVGQLDGGHIVYAVFGPRIHRIVSFLTLGGLAVCGFLFWWGYLVFGGLVYFVAFKHPRTFYDEAPLGATRILLAILALVVFILTFMPVPVEIVGDVHNL